MGDLIARTYNFDSSSIERGWHYTENVASGETSEPVKIKSNENGLYHVSIALIAGTGDGKMQYTLDSDAEIDADTAIWFDWELGTCTGNTIDAIVSPVSAVRCVSVSGAMTFKILI